MRKHSIALTGIFLLNFVSGNAIGQINKRLFLLEDSEHHQWCAYRSESDWATEVRSLTAMIVGTLEYSGDHVAKISVTQEDAAGDWTVYDHYAIDDKGQVREIKRTINILPGDRSEEETYLVINGKAKKQASSSRRLSTKGELPEKEKGWLPNLPIVTRIQDFPFASLIPDKGPELAPDKLCAPTKQREYGARAGAPTE